MNFNKGEVLGFVLQILKRLFNTYPVFRKALEDPIAVCSIKILKLYQAQVLNGP